MTMEYYDNTRVSAAKNCLRMFFFRHVLHLVRDGRTKEALAFGGSWHNAMDVVWGLAHSDKTNQELAQMAGLAFDKKWQEEGFKSFFDMTPDEQNDLAPRTPGVAMEMLSHYIEQRRSFIRSTEVLSIERPFAVPLDPEDKSLRYIGRRDKDFRKDDGTIHCGEHKTTSWYLKAGGFRNEFIESFSPNSQVEGYIHSGYMDYGAAFRSVMIDAALVHKQVHDKFKFIPITRNLARMEEWRMDTLYWVDKIRENKQAWKSGQYAFPRNTSNCFSYGSPCAYIDICRFHQAPLDITEPPPGFVVEKWEPFNELNIAALGLEDEEDKN